MVAGRSWRRVHTQHPKGESSRLVRRAVAAFAALSLLAHAPQALEPVESEAVVVPDAAVIELVRNGLRDYSNGKLAAADATWARIRELQPGHPAAPTFELKTLQSRRTLDFWGGQFEPAIRERAEEAVLLSREWLEGDPGSTQALFYLGQALLEMMVIDGMAGKYYKAGVQGEEARKHLERALELDPTFIDAKFPLGVYYYYGSIATRYVPFLRWLWFVPQGDRDAGLAYIDEARLEGELLRFEAATRLAIMYNYVEERPELAEPILQSLHELHPENSSVHFELVELHLKLRDYPATSATALALEKTQGRQFGDETRRVMARIWRARAELYQGRISTADALIRPLETRFDELGDWSQRWLLVVRGQLHDVGGERERAITSYSRVSQKEAPFGTRRSSELAKSGLDEPFNLDMPSLVAAPVGAQ